MLRKLSLFAILAAFAAAAPAQVIYQTGFESADGFSGGAGSSIANIDNWAVLAGDAKITTTNPQFGTQAVELDPNTVIDRSISANNAIIWVRGWFRGTGSAGAPTFPPSPAASAIIFFSSTFIQAFDGDRAGGAGNGFQSTTVALDQNTWREISLRLDYTNQDYDVWIDGTSRLTGMGFRDNVTQLNGFQNLASETSFFDTFSVVARLIYDANGDGAANVADIVRIVNHIAGTTITDPILFDNADANLDSSVNATDRAALENFLLGL